MRNFNYNLTIAYECNEVEIRTNDVDTVCGEWFGCQNNTEFIKPNALVLVDGLTGEVLADIDFENGESYFTREWHYILGGYFLMNF